jgi:hypothetical protein
MSILVISASICIAQGTTADAVPTSRPLFPSHQPEGRRVSCDHQVTTVSKGNQGNSGKIKIHEKYGSPFRVTQKICQKLQAS